MAWRPCGPVGSHGGRRNVTARIENADENRELEYYESESDLNVVFCSEADGVSRERERKREEERQRVNSPRTATVG